MEAKSNSHPLRFVSIQADAAAQTAFMLPIQSPVTHGTDRYRTGSFDALAQVFVVLLDFLVVFHSIGIISLFRKKSCLGTFTHYLYLSLKHGKVYDDVTPVLYYVLSTPCLVYLLHFTPGGTVNAKRSWRCSSRTSS